MSGLLFVPRFVFTLLLLCDLLLYNGFIMIDLLVSFYLEYLLNPTLHAFIVAYE